MIALRPLPAPSAALLLTLLSPVLAQERTDPPARPTPPAAAPLRIVFQQGVALPIDALDLQDDTLVVTRQVGNTPVGTKIPLEDGIYVTGARPPGIGNGLALLLDGKPGEALRELGPILNSQLSTAKTPGNYWVDTARIAAIAYVLDNNRSGLGQVKEALNDAVDGEDPIFAVAEELDPASIYTPEAKAERLLAKVDDANPAIVNALIYYYVGEIRRAALDSLVTTDEEGIADSAEEEPTAEDAGESAESATETGSPEGDAEAEAAAAIKKARAQALSLTLEAYLTVPNVYPSGDLLINAAAEYQAAGLLLDDPERREEAVALLNSAERGSRNTPLAEQVKQRIDSAK